MENLSELTCLHVIVKEGKAEEIIFDLKEKGLVSGATIMLAQGTADNEILKFLELHHQRKELIIMAINKKDEELAMKELEKKLDKKNAGIGFSIDIFNASWSKANEREEYMDRTKSEFEALFVVVDRGEGDDVVDIAQDAGAKGATILHGRGTGTSVVGEVFDMLIEPEKDIVLMLIEKKNIDAIIKDISDKMEIEKPNKGIIFAMDVNKTVGLVK